MKRLLHNTPLAWISLNSRFYYATFYIITALVFLGLAMTFQISDVASIVDIWPGPNFWSILYVIISCLSGYLAFNTKKDASESSPQYKLRALITMLISGASLSRGIIILILFGNVAGFILQLWFAFVIVWAAPLIFFLPSEIDEYVTLMDRVDRLDKRVDGILNGKSK